MVETLESVSGQLSGLIFVRRPHRCRCPSTRPVFEPKSRKCYPTCPAGTEVPNDSPMGANYCSKLCPTQYPIQINLKQCSTSDGRGLWDRVPKTQVGIPATLTSFGVLDRASSMIPKECPPGAGTMLSASSTHAYRMNKFICIEITMQRPKRLTRPCRAESRTTMEACVTPVLHGLKSVQ